jgi:hypothetical protein
MLDRYKHGVPVPGREFPPRPKKKRKQKTETEFNPYVKVLLQFLPKVYSENPSVSAVFLVLLETTQFSGPHAGRSRATHSSIQKKAKLSRSTVCRALSRLKEIGAIKTVHRGRPGTSSLYQLKYVNTGKDHTHEGCHHSTERVS